MGRVFSPISLWKLSKALSICKFSLSQIRPVNSPLYCFLFPGKKVQILFVFCGNPRQLLLNTVLKSEAWGPLCLVWLMCPCWGLLNMHASESRLGCGGGRTSKARQKRKSWQQGKIITAGTLSYAPLPSSLLTSALKVACVISAWNTRTAEAHLSSAPSFTDEAAEVWRSNCCEQGPMVSGRARIWAWLTVQGSVQCKLPVQTIQWDKV